MPATPSESPTGSGLPGPPRSHTERLRLPLVSTIFTNSPPARTSSLRPPRTSSVISTARTQSQIRLPTFLGPSRARLSKPVKHVSGPHQSQDSSFGAPLLGSVVENFLSGVKKLEEDIAHTQDLLAKPSETQTKTIEHSIQDRPFDPDGTSDTDVAIILGYAYKSGGPALLARALQQTAQKYSEDNNIDKRSYYRHVANPQNQMHIMNILGTQHHRFIKHLIDGDLAWFYMNDFSCTEQFTDHHSLANVPGCYVQAHVQQTIKFDASTSGGINPDRGRWLTGRQIRQFYDTARMYLDPQTAADYKQIEDIEGRYQTNRKFVLGEKYLYGTGRVKIEQWLHAWQQRWIVRIDKLLEEERRTGIKKDILDKPLKYAPLEIGYGVDVKARAMAHNTHDSSNVIFTFYQAVCHQLFDHHGKIFQVVPLMTNRIPHYEDDQAYLDALLSDVCQTMLPGAEWFHGGLNPVPGGGAGVGEVPLLKRNHWLKKSFRLIYEHSALLRDNTNEGTKQLEALEQKVARCKKIDEEMEEQKKLAKAVSEGLEKAEARVKDLKEVAILMEARQAFAQYEVAVAAEESQDENSDTQGDH